MLKQKKKKNNMDIYDLLTPDITSDFLIKENPTESELEAIINNQQLINGITISLLEDKLGLEDWADANISAGLNPDKALDALYWHLINEGFEI